MTVSGAEIALLHAANHVVILKDLHLSINIDCIVEFEKQGKSIKPNGVQSTEIAVMDQCRRQ